MRAPSACLPSLVLLLSVAWSEARAQAPAWGPWIGYEAGVPWDLNRRPGAVDWCNCDGSGRASEQVLSAGMALRWPDALGRAWGLSAGAGALLRIGVFRSDPYVTAPFADPSSGAIVSSRAEFEARTRGGDLFAEASLSFSPFGRFALHAGPWTAWRIAGSWSLRERFLDVDRKSVV